MIVQDLREILDRLDAEGEDAAAIKVAEALDVLLATKRHDHHR